MSLKALLATLEGDEWRKDNPFSPEILTVSEVLLHPYARNDERQVAIRAWLVKHQPCVFGQIAAKADNLYITIVTQAQFDKGEDAVREYLALEKETWKQWSLEGNGRHGFLVVFATSQLHHAAPNQALKEVSNYLRDMFIKTATKDPAGNDICHD